MDTPKRSWGVKKRVLVIGVIVVMVGLVITTLALTGVIHLFKQPVVASFSSRTAAVRSDASAAVSKMAYRQFYLGDVDGAVATIDKALAAEPAASTDRLFLLRDKGDIQMSAHRYDDAVATYKLAVAIDPQGAVTLEGLGQAYQNAGQRDAARAEYKLQLKAAQKSGLAIQIEDAQRNLQEVDE